MISCHLCLVLFLCCFLSVFCQPDVKKTHETKDRIKESNLENENFVATHEWKEIKEGQAIPRGLHVRINMQTGLKEAKLMEEVDEESNTNTKSIQIRPTDDETSTQVPDESEASSYNDPRSKHLKNAMEETILNLQKNSEDPKKEKILDLKNSEGRVFTREEIKEALKNFKSSKADSETSDTHEKGTFRSMDQLKSEFKKLKADFKSELEVLKQHTNFYLNASLNVDDKLSVMQEIEYYVHQIDNAQNFITLGGLDQTIKDLNSTHSIIRKESALIIGSASQSNPKVQIHCVEGGALQLLIRLLSTDDKKSQQSRYLYALSSLLRHFPYAQQRFLSLGGLEALGSLFKKHGFESLQIKAITLVSDLLLEKEQALKLKDNSNATLEKIKQYESVRLLRALVDNGWCSLIAPLLSVDDHDSREKLLSAMLLLHKSCARDFSQSAAILRDLKVTYRKLADAERTENDEDQYFTKMFNLFDSIIKSLLESVKEEL